MKPADSLAWWRASTVGDATTVPDRRDELLARLRHGPGEEARHEIAVTPSTPVPRCWTLRTIRATVAWLQGYGVSGGWRLVRHYKLKLRSARVQHDRPDPDYTPKLAHLEPCRRRVAQAPQQQVVVFLDELGDPRWPEPAARWAAVGSSTVPVAQRRGTNTQQWRIIGAVNAWTGQVT